MGCLNHKLREALKNQPIHIRKKLVQFFGVYENVWNQFGENSLTLSYLAHSRWYWILSTNPFPRRMPRFSLKRASDSAGLPVDRFGVAECAEPCEKNMVSFEIQGVRTGCHFFQKLVKIHSCEMDRDSCELERNDANCRSCKKSKKSCEKLGAIWLSL